MNYKCFRKYILFIVIICSVAIQQLNAQSIGGFWYGNGNPKMQTSTNNYLIELILKPEKGTNRVTGYFNYYFKSLFRTVPVTGRYNAATRTIDLNEFTLTYHGSLQQLEVDCPMRLNGTLRVSKFNSVLSGILYCSNPDNKLVCTEIAFYLQRDNQVKNVDSAISALKKYKEEFQFWQPPANEVDSFSKNMPVIQLPETDTVLQEADIKKIAERTTKLQQVIDVVNDSVTVAFYDNGEIDGDTISIYYNKKLVLGPEKISTKPVGFTLYLNKEDEDHEIIMYAVNLGTIPPNTALMVITDGDKKYQVRLSSDLNNSASVIIRRKKKGA